MNWLPTFLSPLTAAVAAGVVIPSLLLLYFLKLRRTQRDVASTILWKKSIQDLQVNAPFQRLRRNLLLLLQLLLLALLLLALARPVALYTPGAGKSTVILIDRSASMSARDIEGRTRLDEAKRLARELVDTMGRDATAMVIAFDEEARAVQPFTSDRNLLRRAIDSVEPTDRRSRLKLAYQLAEAQVAFIPEQNRTNVDPPEVWVYSDGRVADAAELQIRAPVKFVPIGTADAKNIGVVALSAKRNYERPNEVQVFARLGNFGPEPVRAQVQLSVATLDGPAAEAEDRFVVGRVAEVSLAPERWTEAQREAAARDGSFVVRDSVEFTVDLTSAAVIRIEQMNREGDALAADDAASVVVPPPRPLRLLLVTDGNYYLERAVDSVGGVERPRQLQPADYDANPPGDVDVTIFDRHSPARLPPGGNFIYFGGTAPGLRVSPQRGPDGQPVFLEEQGVLDWRRDHPVLRGISLGRLFVGKALKLNVPPDVPALIDGERGPLAVLLREGRGTHLFVAFDLLESNWPLRQTFPVFVQQAIQFLAMGSDLNIRQAHAPGASPVLPRSNLARVAGGEPRRLRLSGPPAWAARDIEVAPEGDVALPALDLVGVYRTEPPVPQHERLPVNLLDAGESNLIPETQVPGGVGEAVSAAGRRSRVELWWWIVAVAAVPLLLIEWWAYTRRVHL